MLADGTLRSVPATHRRWILVHALALTAAINLIVNAGIAWLSVIGMRRVPLWGTPIIGGPSTITDTLGTLFLLPIITNLLITIAIGRELRSGRLSPLHRLPDLGPILRLLPHSRPGRGFALATGCLVVLAPPAVAILIATDFGNIPASGFVLYKAIFGIILGAIVTPVIALHAMASAASTTTATVTLADRPPPTKPPTNTQPRATAPTRAQPGTREPHRRS